MKPRELNSNNWDVNVAVYEAPGFEARVTADGRRMWFHVSIGVSFADIMIPISDFRKAVDFIGAFDPATLTEEHSEDGLRLRSYAVEIFSRVGAFKKGKWVKKRMPYTVRFAPLKRYQSHSIVIRLSLFKKIIRWYNSDI